MSSEHAHCQLFEPSFLKLVIQVKSLGMKLEKSLVEN